MKRVLKRYCVQILLLGVLLLFCVVLICNNRTNEDFWDANAYEIITLITVGSIVVLISENGNNRRRRNDSIIHIVNGIEKYMSVEKHFTYSESAYFEQASIANRIKYLKDA